MTNTADRTRRLAWLKERRKGCGASDVAAIAGASPWGSPWSVWADKCGLTPLDADLDDDDPRTFGLDLEDVIAMKFERQRPGLYVHSRQEILHHEQEPWCFATVDGLVHDVPRMAAADADPLGVFESKYTGDPPWDTMPDHYRIAGDWQMYVTGLPRLWLACLHLPFGRPQLRIYELERDDDRIADLVATVTQFWLDHVVTGTPPPTDAHRATTEAIRLVWGADATTGDGTIDLTDHAALVDELANLRKQKATLEWLLDKVENGVKALIAERGSDDGLSDGYVDGELAVSWRSQPDTRLDTKAVRADHGTAYDKTTIKRVLRLHGKRNP